MSASAFPVPQSELNETRPDDGFVDRFGGRYYRIANVDRMPVFFMNVVRSSDVWLFLASNGALSAGRANADHALFPYQTVDRIYDASAHTGGCTAVLCERGDETVLWEPFSAHGPRYHPIERHIYKSLEGDRVWLEEIHPALGIAFRCGWTATDEHGLVRLVEIENLGGYDTTVRILDGVRNLMVPGVSQRLQNEYSCLTDAYKSAESVPGTSLAVFSLAAGIVDRPIPMESLLATIVWSEGWSEARITLAADAYDRFLAGRPSDASRARGTRACYALEGKLTLAPGQSRRWRIALDTDRSQIDISELADRLRDPVHIHSELDACLAAGSARLRALVASADGLQLGGDEIATAHHFANTLFNIMRGGVFAFGHEVDTPDFLDFARLRNRPAAVRHAALIAGLPARLAHPDFIARLSAPGDPDLERIALEYLPLTFSRRHGDPSRPWNRFNIRVRDAAGNRVLNHEGNWRDIFQNWEALCVSFPSFCESIVAKFVNASTADGYNPYRITRAGIDWEVPEPHDHWASIGYWGDHQTVYLLKLLEWSARFHPGLADSWLRRPVFAYAAVPYRISNYAAIRANPRSTISFDADAHRRIAARAAEFGTDARLLAGPQGGVLHVNLSEKLLLLVLTRLTNFVPGGGIWMNTQRPEWNDANNALVGNGLSVVTLAYLRRFLAHLRDQVLPALGRADVPVSSAVAVLLREMTSVLDGHAAALAAPDGFDDEHRRVFVDAAGEAGSRYRDTVYREGPGSPVPVSVEAVARLVRSALDYADHSLRANRRPDGLWHAYNLLRFSETPPALSVGHLAPMLEGQVAILSSGVLAPDEVVALLRALRQSPLYRADQHSYLLYPDKQLPGFLLRNHVPAAAVEGNELLTRLARDGDRRLVARDSAGGFRFHPDLGLRRWRWPRPCGRLRGTPSCPDREHAACRGSCRAGGRATIPRARRRCDTRPPSWRSCPIGRATGPRLC